MDRDNYFRKYSLCANSLDKLNEIKSDHTSNDYSKMRDAWRTISWEEPEKSTVEQENDDHNTQAAPPISPANTNEHGAPESTQATQYGLTQNDRSSSMFDSTASIANVTDYLYESLERSSEKLELNLLWNNTDSELSMITNDLSKKLSHKGIYNLCHSICGMRIEFGERLMIFVCKNVLLNAIISMEEPSRLVNSAIGECAGKFPDDIENFIFIPVLNSDLKEITTILSITSSLDIQQKRAYISLLSAEVKDLKQWHIVVLQDLLVVNLDENTKENLLNLLWKKSHEYSKDKNYGKLLLNILKTNPPTTIQQKYFFEEIVAVHNTLFKKLIDKILETISIV